MNEVCACCGEYVAALDEVTGWCDSCAGVKTCRCCGERRRPEEYLRHPRMRDGRRSKCVYCDRQTNRERYAAGGDAARVRSMEKVRRHRAKATS